MTDYPMGRVLFYHDGPEIHMVEHPLGTCVAMGTIPGTFPDFDWVAFLAAGTEERLLLADKIDVWTLMTRPGARNFGVNYPDRQDAERRQIVSLTPLLDPLPEDALPSPGLLWSDLLSFARD